MGGNGNKREEMEINGIKWDKMGWGWDKLE